MKLLYINPVGTAAWDKPIFDEVNGICRADTLIDVCSLRSDKVPVCHLESLSYMALASAELIKVIHWARSHEYDGCIIGCFYDPLLDEAREISGDMVVTAPCESACSIASQIGTSFSVLVGRSKWIPRMKENVIKYGHKGKLSSFQSLDMGVPEFQKDPKLTEKKMIEHAKIAVEEGSEVIILGCTLEFGFYKSLSERVGVPVVDAIVAPVKNAEYLVDLRNFGLKTSRVHGGEEPPQNEVDEWNVWNKDDDPIGNIVRKTQ